MDDSGLNGNQKAAPQETEGIEQLERRVCRRGGAWKRKGFFTGAEDGKGRRGRSSRAMSYAEEVLAYGMALCLRLTVHFKIFGGPANRQEAVRRYIVCSADCQLF